MPDSPALPAALAPAFAQHFGAEPELLVRAPGRINLIGEHTDYNDGFVVPAAIDKEIFFALRLNGTDQLRLHALDLNERREVGVDQVAPLPPGHWANYLLGVVAGFQQRGVAVPGFDCAFGGTIPAGAGLSSSAAVECGLAWGLNQLLHLGLDNMTLAKLAQHAEHTYARVLCGLMDQFASLHGRAGQVVRLDCRSLDYEYFPFDTAACRLVLCNSGVKHELASSEYNHRRAECARGVEMLAQHHPEVHSLRDATLNQIEAHRAELGDVVYRRCRYVVEENARTEAATAHLGARHALADVGALLYASHAGLRDLYEVSCPELDTLVELSRQAPGAYGARMMGGGFGGCTINLVETGQVENFVAYMVAGYRQAHGIEMETYVTTLVEGVNQLENRA